MNTRCLTFIVVLAAYAAFADAASSGYCGSAEWTLDSKGVFKVTGSSMSKCDFSDSDAAKIKEVVIGDGISSIPMQAFIELKGIKTLTLGKDVTKIGWGAFAHCENLATINFNKKLRIVDELALQHIAIDKLDLPDSLETIGNAGFSHCDNLVSVTAKNVRTIDMNAFYGCGKLKSVTFGDSLERIRSWGFTECRSLRSIRLPKKFEFMGKEVFENCTELGAVIFEGDEDPTPDAKDVFIGCKNLINICVPSTYKSDSFCGSKKLVEMSKCKIPSSASMLDVSAFVLYITVIAVALSNLF